MLRHHCGIFGIINHHNASWVTYLGLYALQHRGQESSGIVSSDGYCMYEYKGVGLVNDVFANRSIFGKLLGDSAIGHNRYSTTGATELRNAQPFLINTKVGSIAAAHNGNLTNAQLLRNQMENEGSIFTTTTDSEVILHLLAKSRRATIPEMIADALSKVKGAFSLLFLTPEMLIAVKDPFSFRPLAIGRIDGAYVFASETCAFDLIGAEFIRCVEPGEIVIARRDGTFEDKIFPWGKPDYSKTAACIFEFIYFSRPDSFIFGASVDKIRRRMGEKLAEEHPADADIVISVPDSSNTTALGYAHKLGIPFEIGLIRNHYIGRTFIQPSQTVRELGVKLKFNPVRGVLKNKRVVVVDDSIVRGTTSKKLVKMLYCAGAKEIHLRIASPPIVNPCFCGIDTPTKDELIASSCSVEKIREFIGVDSLGYLSLDGLLSVPGLPQMGYCTACFGTHYPIET